MKKEIKISRISSTKMRTVGKFLLWFMLGTIFVKGAADIVMGNTISKQREAMESYMDAFYTEQKLSDGTRAFAEEFVREYFTFSEGEEDYESRIAFYTAQNLRIEAPEKGVISSVIAANSVDVELVDKEHVNVTVIAELQLDKKRSKISVKVPIAAKNGSYAVDEYPQIVPGMETADVESSSGTLEGTEVSNDEKDQITSVIESFCKVYYGGSDNELMYFVAPESGIKNVVDDMEFDSIDELRAVYNVEKDSYMIETKIKVANSGMVLLQHLYLTAEKEGNRFYIIKIDTR